MSDLKVIEVISKKYNKQFKALPKGVFILPPIHMDSYQLNEEDRVIALTLFSKETSDIPEELVELSELERLSLFHHGFDNLSIVTKLYKLTMLHVIEHNLKDLAHLAHLPYLRSVSMTSSSQLVNPPGVVFDLGWMVAKDYLLADLQPKEDITTANLGSVIEAIYKTTEEESSQALPHAIKQFKIQDFRGIRDLHLKDLPSKAQWIVLTGHNGFGKTSVLQGLLIALFGRKDGNILLDEEEKINCMVEYRQGQGASQINIGGTAYFKPFKKFAAYGASRLNKGPRSGYNELRTYSLFYADAVLLDIEEKLIGWENSPEQRVYFEATKAILLDLMSPAVEDLKVQRQGPKNEVVYKEKLDVRYKPFKALASGFKSIVAMVGDMLIRLSEEQPEVSDFKQLSGLVIIDEFDLHMHPQMQKDLVVKLSELFPQIQFIISTHSPIPLLGCPPGRTVILNVQRNEEDGISIRRLHKIEQEFQYLLPSQLLSSPIFELEELENKYLKTKDLEQLDYANDRYEDLQAKREYLRDIKAKVEDKGLFPDNLLD